MPEDLGERTEEATPKRRQEARSEGNVARSQDFSAAILLIAATLVLWAAASALLRDGAVLVAQVLGGNAPGDPFSPEGARPLAMHVGAWGVRLAAPLLLIIWAVAAVGGVFQVGWLFAPEALRPSLRKLDPLKGAQRIFGVRGLVKAGFDSVKLVAVGAVALITVLQHAETIVLLAQLPVLQAAAEAAAMMLDLALRVLALLLLLGLIDLVYQRWRHGRDLRMTRQEVQDEMKQTEGDPDVKRRRLRMQQQIAMQRVSAAVPKADVVVTNPQHISIAIKYDAEKMGAPKVIAKGADFLALRIRQIAMAHAIPIVERKPLARALYKHVEVGQEVPPQFYKAVAEILAYVYRLRGAA